MSSKGKQLSELLDANGDVLQVNLDNVIVNPAAVSDKENTSTGGFSLPAGTTAQRPSSPDTGETRYNSDSGSIEFYDDTNWIATNLIPTITTVSGNIYNTISSDLTLSISNSTESIDVIFSESGTDLATLETVAVSSGSATVTVPSAVYNQTTGDTITIRVNNADGTPSSNSQTKTVVAIPTGGTVTTSGNYKIHTFTSSGNFVVPTGFSTNVEALIVAGGGGGGLHSGGGGGAGGLLYYGAETPKTPNGSAIAVSAQTYSIVVGAAGASSGGNYQAVSGEGGDGGDSSALGYTAIGGGGGASGGNPAPAGNGGSGGGGGRGIAAGTGTAGQGNDGGLANTGSNPNYPGGGGGGSAQVGGSGSTGAGGGGGNGHQYSISGSATYYAGGGGGTLQDVGGGIQGAGGLGGGGNGRDQASGDNGTTNTGGGGGGGHYQSSGGAGGSGIIIVRYDTSALT